MDLESFLGFELNSGFGPFFCFYRQRIDLARFMGCFLSVLGQQWVENMFLSQTKKPCFSGHTSGRIVGLVDDASFFFLEIAGANNGSSAPFFFVLISIFFVI
jgi:hypothetical protein